VQFKNWLRSRFPDLTDDDLVFALQQLRTRYRIIEAKHIANTWSALCNLWDGF